MKRNPKNYCLICSERCKNNPANLCSLHYRIKEANDYGDEYSIDSFKSTNSRHRYQNVRNHAHRVVDLLDRKRECSVCGYSKYVELCHIKGISTYDSSTKLSIVNHPDNLIYLCPNHHWELDNK